MYSSVLEQRRHQKARACYWLFGMVLIIALLFL